MSAGPLQWPRREVVPRGEYLVDADLHLGVGARDTEPCPPPSNSEWERCPAPGPRGHRCDLRAGHTHQHISGVDRDCVSWVGDWAAPVVDPDAAARACMAAFHRALGVPVTWDEVPEAERQAWRAGAAAIVGGGR